MTNERVYKMASSSVYPLLVKRQAYGEDYEKLKIVLLDYASSLNFE